LSRWWTAGFYQFEAIEKIAESDHPAGARPLQESENTVLRPFQRS
jgi:hypothetical protein